MIKKLHETPKIWLNLDICRTIYDLFKPKVHFDQPLSSFDDRYEGRLESVLGAVRQSYGETFFYPTILDVSAAYLVKINVRHAFFNGNKRMSILYTDNFLLLNEVNLVMPHEDIYNLAAFITLEHHKGVSEERLSDLCKTVIADFSVDFKSHQKAHS